MIENIIFLKGAPEVVIDACSYCLRPNGYGINKLDHDQLRKLYDVTREFSNIL